MDVRAPPGWTAGGPEGVRWAFQGPAPNSPSLQVPRGHGDKSAQTAHAHPGGSQGSWAELELQNMHRVLRLAGHTRVGAPPAQAQPQALAPRVCVHFSGEQVPGIQDKGRVDLSQGSSWTGFYNSKAVTTTSGGPLVTGAATRGASLTPRGDCQRRASLSQGEGWVRAEPSPRCSLRPPLASMEQLRVERHTERPPAALSAMRGCGDGGWCSCCFLTL